MLIEISSNEEVKKEIVPILEGKGYEYFWRPSIGDEPPFYAWFIKRNREGRRTHHLHMVEKDSPLWDRIYFRDYLRLFSDEAREYAKLKSDLAKELTTNRISYTLAKSDFIKDITEKAKKYFKLNC